ncbi:alpha/beta hydrolase family protein [Amycolatopsis thermophila]|uniref:Dienelactone hydrolase n=1 Tax=Amycolatopsis thermophila TaxID=206084 RepID=A0ABU0EQF7_9PSEU|nr:alpha/beta fold hydrolase [Amycolatopsis thermophila]MDQ0377215.1 dienelactone hydrolase [Amycolatopsis thermophila]
MWEPPDYAVPESFVEHEVAGTLTLPVASGPRPGVVLLAGGGPVDRDETSGPNKPLKDLAWGLASRGVAVVRFDKRSGGVTMAEEYVPDSVAAVRLVATESDRVFLVGHSMGGKAAPRVAASEPPVAGLVILAGDTQPMHEAAVRVARHLRSIGAVPAELVDAITRQAAAVSQLTPSAPAEDLLFGFPASYWLDLRDYDPVATAAAVDRPILILQGGRDYQVTVADDLARWRAGLADRDDVTIRVHEAADHLFFPGTQPSTPAQYAERQHVDAAVIDDIASWIQR